MNDLVFGCASIGGLYKPASAKQAHQALTAAWDAGIRAFDTAPHYGVGQSEEFLGAFLRDRPRDEITLSTKVGRLLVEDPDAQDGTEGYFGNAKRSRVRDYSGDGIRRSLEESLERLGLDRVDTLFVHDPEDHMDAAIGEAAPALADLRDQGVIGSFGVGTNYAEVARRFVDETACDRLMIAGRYSLLDRRAEDVLLDRCAERGVEVLVAGVLNSGLLADPAPGAPFNYEPAPTWLIEVAQGMQAACARHGVSLRAAALQFPIRHRAITALVTGAGRPETVRDTVESLRVTVPEELWAELEELVPEQDRLPSS